MEKEYGYLLRLMGDYLREEEPAAADVDWNALVQLARMNSVTGVLGYLTMVGDICPDPELRRLLQDRCRQTIAGTGNRAAMAQLLSARLKDNGIRHIFMKGYVLRDYYPVPELRTFGDIDLVIELPDREKCHRLMLEQGFEPITDWEPVYSYRRQTEHYELHTELIETDVSGQADFRGYFQGLWQHVISNGENSLQFEPEYHFLYLMVHLAKHIKGSGAGIRMYMDIAVFLRRFPDLDWDWIWGELERQNFTAFSGTVLAFVRRYFGVDCPGLRQDVEDRVLEELAELSLSGGTFGRFGKDPGTLSLEAENRGEERISRLGALSRRLFPAAKTIESRYTYLRDKPWLLPVAWVHRLVKTRGTWGGHASEARSILSADMDEVRRLRQLHDEIGLGE